MAKKEMIVGLDEENIEPMNIRHNHRGTYSKCSHER